MPLTSKDSFYGNDFIEEDISAEFSSGLNDVVTGIKVEQGDPCESNTRAPQHAAWIRHHSTPFFISTRCYLGSNVSSSYTHTRARRPSFSSNLSRGQDDREASPNLQPHGKFAGMLMSQVMPAKSVKERNSSRLLSRRSSNSSSSSTFAYD
jgi:hypothetical protein